MCEYKDLNCLVYGSGISGKGAAKLLLSKGAYVFLYDEKADTDTEALRAYFTENERERLQIVCGELPDEIREKTGLVVLSPGVPLDNPRVEEFNKRNVKITGEIELASSLSSGDILAITGTNGKTTTTTLLGDIMRSYAESTGNKRKVLVVGNIGEPFTLHAGETDPDTITVAEISSFQLETVHTFKPRVSAVLNVTPDHLNRHHSMENYAYIKSRIMEYQDMEDAAVLNYDDPVTRKMAENAKCRVIFFTRDEELKVSELPEDFVQLKDNIIYYNEREIVAIKDVKLLGTHNYENIMAAVAMAADYGVPDSIIRETVSEFRAVEHRIEFVESVNGVDYYNDSKGTNPDASIKAVEAMVKPTILIGGGYDKKSTYDEFIESFGDKVKLLVLIGETAEKIKQCALKHGFDKIMEAGSLEEAVKICHDNALPGDAVLLSPACASWGMFKNYEERGKLFKEYVRSL